MLSPACDAVGIVANHGRKSRDPDDISRLAEKVVCLLLLLLLVLTMDLRSVGWPFGFVIAGGLALCGNQGNLSCALLSEVGRL